MPKPDPALLNPDRYPFRCAIETRYRDLDSNLHINNGVMASLLEEGRVKFHRASQLGNVASDPELTAMVASVTIDYLGESHWPAPLDMHVAVRRIGNASYELCQLVLQQGKALVLGQVTMVCMRCGRPSPIPADQRDGATSWMLRP